MSSEITKSVLKKANEELNNINAAKPILDDVGVSAFFVLKKLITEAHNFYDEKKDGWFYLAIKHIVDATGYCDKTIRNNIKKLEQKGYIQVDYNNGNISHYKIIKISTVRGRGNMLPRQRGKLATALSHPASFNIKQDNINNKQEGSSGANGYDKKQNLNTEQPNKKKLPNLGHIGAFAPNGGKNMRRTNPGYTRSDLRANSGRAATGEILPAPVQGLGLTAKYTREEIRFAKRWFIYASDKWLTVRRKGWEGVCHKWLDVLSEVTRGEKAIMPLDELVEVLEWAKDNSFFRKNIRELSRLNKKWNWEGGKSYMLEIVADEYTDEISKQNDKKQWNFSVQGIIVEIGIMVKNTLSEKYDTNESDFENMWESFTDKVADIWEWLDKQNSKQMPENKQNWLYEPMCLEKLKQVVRLWNDFGKGSLDMTTHSAWWWFWQKVNRWRENELPKGKPGPWIIDNLKNYMGN